MESSDAIEMHEVNLNWCLVMYVKNVTPEVGSFEPLTFVGSC